MQHYYNGTATKKLSMAHTLHQTCGLRLRGQDAMQEALGHLRLAAGALTSHMRSMGMDQLCCRCAARPGGGCCSAYMADNTDSLQILINLLLDVAVDQRDNEADACCFLGEEGCMFLAKPSFCLNYNCTHIRNTARTGEMAALFRLTGDVLGQQARVETLLLEELRTLPVALPPR